jgi:type III secretion protein Q
MNNQPWHERLRRLSPANAANLCELFRGREMLTLDGEPATTWSFRPARALPLPAAILRSSNEQLLLSIEEDGLCERLGTREWWDYDAESRLLAWVLAHGFLVESLGRLLREPLLPTAWSEAVLSPPDSPDIATLGFSARTPDGRTCIGLLGLSPTLVSRLTTTVGWRSTAHAFAPWLQLPISLRVEIPGRRFPLAELTEARTGDVLIVGRGRRCWSSLRLAAAGTSGAGFFTGSWSASYDGDRLRLGLFATEVPMLEKTPLEPTLEGSDATTTLSAMAEIPVTLDFEVGTLSVPLGEVANLRPGYVFQLPTRLEDARVVIRANGVRIGHGELVAVGDVVGVQLLTIDANGIR